jgi:uncharacterized protein (TIGR00255 family)
MTGYGAARAKSRRIAVEVEARSVNSRSLKVTLRTPAVLSPREPDLEALVRKQVGRGSVTLAVQIKFLRPEDVVRVRTEVVEGFARALAALRKKKLAIGPLTAEAVAALPGALDSAAEAPLRDEDWRAVKDAVEAALRALDTMRTREARHLVRDLLGIARRMRKNLALVGKRAPDVVKEYARRLKEKADALLASSGVSLDDTTLAREVAVYAERSDVAEEVTRLTAHLDEFERYLASQGEVGRTLDFLSQEMLRETNTIGSKSQDVEIARAVITLKSDVDRIKEQVQNLE